MKYLVFGVLLISIIVLSGCSQTVVKYQCADGSFVDSATSCSSVSCKTDCPQLDCASCPVKTETKVETKTVTNTIYVCADLTQVKSLNDCKTTEQKEIETSSSDLILTINGVRTARSIGDYSLEELGSDEQYIIVDFSIYNKGLEKGYEFNPNWVLVEDSKGYSYSYSWDSSQLSKYWGGMAGVTVEYNSKKSGELAFVVPKAEKQFTLVVKDFLGVKGKKTFSVG